MLDDELAARKLAGIERDYERDKAFVMLRKIHREYVPGHGSLSPRIMMVGEAPGATEVLERRPFVGAAGRSLDVLLSFAKISRQDCFLTNAVRYRPPNNRTPHPYEYMPGLPYLRREWRAIGHPRIVVALGRVAWLTLTTELMGSTNLRIPQGGYFMHAGGETIWRMLHPIAPQYQAHLRDIAMAQWKNFGEWLRNND